MVDELTHQDRLLKKGRLAEPAEPRAKKEPEAAEASCAAFGYLRGIRDHASMVELRFRDGNTTWLPYGWLGPCRHDASEGLLLKFSGDLVYLVLIRGSNLESPLNDGHMNLTSGGLQRRRVVWIREMSEEDIKTIGETGPTIDSIEVAEFQSQAELKEWLSKHAPGFVR